MSEEPRPDDAPQIKPPMQHTAAPQTHESKRRFLIKALKLGTAVPVVMTISTTRARASTGSAAASG